MNNYSFFTIDRRDIPKIRAIMNWKEDTSEFLLNVNDVITRLELVDISDDLINSININNEQYMHIDSVIALTKLFQTHQTEKIQNWLLNDIIPSVSMFQAGNVRNL